LIEESVDHWDDNEDKIYKSVIAWQDAGGRMTDGEDTQLIVRVYTALLQVSTARWEEIYKALMGTRRLTWKDRLESSVVGAGTDDTGLEATIKDVPDAVLVREWSNLSTYRERAKGAKSEAEVQGLADFIVDIDNDTKSMIKGDRDDWLELVGQLREKLITALKKPEIAKIAQDEFHYTVRDRVLARLRYAQSAAYAEHDRGPGFWNDISMSLMDTGSATGAETEKEFGEAHGARVSVEQSEEGSEEEKEALTHAAEQNKEYLSSHSDYSAAKASVAGGIAGTSRDAGDHPLGRSRRSRRPGFDEQPGWSGRHGADGAGHPGERLQPGKGGPGSHRRAGHRGDEHGAQGCGQLSLQGSRGHRESKSGRRLAEGHLW
jgi:hypothetical protein